MKDFFVPKDSLLFSNSMGMNSDFSVRGFGGGLSEAMATMTVTVSAVAGNLWTPSEMTTALWLDAADATTITLNGSNVSQWADKSGNGRHATQANSGLQPAYTNNGVVFESDALSIPAAAYPRGGLGYTIMALMQSSATGHASVGLININSSPSDNPELRIGRVNDIHDYFAGGYLFSGFDASCLTHGVLAFERSTGITATIFRNGNQLEQRNRSGSLSNIATFSLGYYDRVNKYRNGTIRECIVFQNSAENRQKLEGYVAHRWDALLGVTTLVSALPSDHPHKSAAPTA